MYVWPDTDLNPKIRPETQPEHSQTHQKPIGLGPLLSPNDRLNKENRKIKPLSCNHNLVTIGK